jgi:hypothetical protein
LRPNRLLTTGLLLLSTSALAAPPKEEPHILVVGQRQRGAVIGDIKPEEQLGPADIRAYGASSVSELLDDLSAQTRSDRGRGGEQPVVLLNGRRISSFSEIRDIPTEAIQRVDILPEEVALKYGYSADQRVVNVVLRRRFRAVTGQLDGSTSTDGGGNSEVADADLLRIHGDSRFNLDLKAQDSASLRESDRDLTSRTGGPPSDQRTLSPAKREYTANSVLSRPALGRATATINATIDYTETDVLRGSASTDPLFDGPPLAQTIKALTGHLGASLNGDSGHWRWSLTANYDHGDTWTRTDRRTDPAGSRLTDHAHAQTDTGNVQLVLAGPLLDVPAGQLNTSIKAGGEIAGFNSTSTRGGIAQASDLSRKDANARLNFDLPLTSRKNDVLGFAGDLSANFNVALDRFSDFGTLTSYGYGANWTVRDGIRLIASVTHDRGAPTIQQIGNPVVLTPDVRAFDYLTGTTVDITQIGGGNAALVADHRQVFKLGLTLKPWSKTDLTITTNYVESHIRNPIASFPEPTAALEAAFPDRFVRDGDGDLIRVDARPINFAHEDRQELRWGINYSRPLKSKNAAKLFQAMRDAGVRFGPRDGGGPPPDDRDRDRSGTTPGGDSNRPADGQPPPGDGFRGGGFGGGGFGGSGRGGRGGGASGRLQFSFYHTWHFRDDILIRDGLPRLDLLDGGAVGATGGQSRHEIEMQIGYSNNGIGARLTGNWQSATDVRGGAGPAGDLHFSPLMTANLRLFVNLGQQPSLVKHGWARGARITLAVNNIFNDRLQVHDANGLTPLRYQPDYLDPLGRAVKLSFRKLFF